MRFQTTLIITSVLVLGAYALPGCDEGGSKSQGPAPQSTTTPSAGSAEGSTSANTRGAPNPHGGDAGSNAGTHGAIQPESGTQQGTPQSDAGITHKP